MRTRPSGRMISEADPRIDGVDVEEEGGGDEERGTVAEALLWRRVLDEREDAARLGLLLLLPLPP